MPPWKAAPGDVEFANARRLTDEQIDDHPALGRGWRARGRRPLLPALPRFTEGWQLGPPDLAVTMSEAFEVPASGPDVYRSFVVPLNLDRTCGCGRSISGLRHERSYITVCSSSTRPAARASVTRAIPVPGSAAAWAGRAPRRSGGVVAARRAARRRRGADDPPADPIARVAGGLGGWALGGRALELPTVWRFRCQRDPI